MPAHRKAPGELSPGQAAVAELHRQEFLVPEIAQRAGLTPRTVQQYLHELGLVAHRPHRQADKPRVTVARTVRPKVTALDDHVASAARRPASVTIRITDEEVAQLQADAEDAGIELAELIRRRILLGTKCAE
jgi:hypothetical protein